MFSGLKKRIRQRGSFPPVSTYTLNSVVYYSSKYNTKLTIFSVKTSRNIKCPGAVNAEFITSFHE
jgi:hypothetical protein